jgi:DNA mismatch repair protein MSH4
MNARMKDALDETLMLSDKCVLFIDKTRPQFTYIVLRIIQDIVGQIIHDIGALYKASEAVRLR